MATSVDKCGHCFIAPSSKLVYLFVLSCLTATSISPFVYVVSSVAVGTKGKNLTLSQHPHVCLTLIIVFCNWTPEMFEANVVIESMLAGLWEIPPPSSLWDRYNCV